MAPNRKIWTQARNRLAAETVRLGYPEEFADLLARQLGSPKAIDRLASYLELARPDSVEMIVDEMLSIRAEIDAWRQKKESLDAQAGYGTWLNSETRRKNGEEP